MAAPVFVTGDVPSDDQFNEWLVNTQIVVKPTNQSRTSTTVVADDNALSFTVDANTSYEVSGMLMYNSQPGDDFKFAFAGPSGATFNYVVAGLDTTAGAFATTTLPLISMPTTLGVGALGATAVGATISGLLVVSSTSGTFKLQWAQFSSSGNGTTVLAGSYIRLRRVA